LPVAVPGLVRLAGHRLRGGGQGDRECECGREGSSHRGTPAALYDDSVRCGTLSGRIRSVAMDLKERTVFITGASSGIGAACARAFAAQGARLLLAARRVERIEAEVAGLKRAGAFEVRVERLDVRDWDAVSRLVGGLSGVWGEIEVLVDNAGLSRGLDKLQEGSLDDWNEMIDTNVKGMLHVDRAVVPLMVARKRGTVVHLGSIAGRQTYPGGNVY